MLLQPRKFKRKNMQKNRTVHTWTSSKLTYGDAGLMTLQPLRMSSRQIFRLKLMLKQAVKPPDLTHRFIWFNTFPHLPLSKKPKGMRMGKGSGKLNTWQSQISGGVFIFEFKNLRPGRAVHFFKRVRTKLPTPTTFHFRAHRHIRLAKVSRRTPIVQGFW